MSLIGIAEAALRVGMTTDGTRAALIRAGVPLVRISPRALAVEEAALKAFMQEREGYAGRGRPRKAQEARTEGASSQ